MSHLTQATFTGYITQFLVQFLVVTLFTFLLQQSMFEVLTSEASYLRSLRVLTEHFLLSRELNDTIIIRDQKTLFSNILRVREVSER